MDKDFFLNAQPHFEMPSWKLMTTTNSPSEKSPAGEFHHPSWKKSMDPYNNNNTCYSTPLNSPPPMPIMDHFVKENLPNSRNSMPISPALPSLAVDPGFAERAAKFSCFGSRSFNGRIGQLGLNSSNNELQFRSSVSPLSKLPRVSSSPSLKIDGSGMAIQEKKMNSAETRSVVGSGSAANSNEESSVSEQIPSGDIGLKNQSDLKIRKRKIASTMAKARAIPKEEGNDDSNSKRVKKTEQENAKTEAETRNNGAGEESESPSQTEKKVIIKATEPPKDYIHVRARRGQATDSHSLAERVRREKISERMKFLQDLVPGCNKVTGKALMLDEIINYVQSLQHQVEFLSMKLATVNPRFDSEMSSQISKDINQSNENLTQQLYPIESCGSTFYQQNPQILFNGPPPPVHGFTETFPQFLGFGEDDLHSIFQMGFGENVNQDNQFLHEALNQTSEMKIEL